MLEAGGNAVEAMGQLPEVYDDDDILNAVSFMFVPTAARSPNFSAQQSCRADRY